MKDFSKTFEELSGDYEGKMKFAKLNVDDSGDLAGKFGVMSIPTVIPLRAPSKITVNIPVFLNIAD